MKYIISSLILFLFLSIPFSNSQDIKWGPVNDKHGGLFGRFHIVGHDDNHYYLNMKPRKKNGVLSKFDYNHRLKSTSPIEFNYEKKKLTPDNFITTASNTFAYVPDFTKNKFNFYISKFNNGKLGKVEKAHSHEYKETKTMWFGLVSYCDGNAPEVDVSENKKYVVFSTASSTDGRYFAEKFGFVVFDENMKMLWKKDMDFPKDKDFKVKQIVVSNSGEIFFTASVREKKTDKKDKRDENQLKLDYKVFHLTKSGLSEIDIKLDNNGRVSKTGLFVHHETNKVYLAGFYTKNKNMLGINGVFFGELNIANKGVSMKTHVFNSELVDNLAGEEGIKEGEGLPLFFNIKNLITFKDGSFSFLAEHTYSAYISIGEGGHMSYTTNEIIIPKFDAKGNLLNIARIDKDFTSKYELESSYSYNAYNGKIYLVFNNAKTKKEVKDFKQSKDEKGKIYRFTDLCIIDEEGSIEVHKTIFSNKDVKFHYLPQLSFGHQDKLILATVLATKFQFGTMQLK